MVHRTETCILEKNTGVVLKQNADKVVLRGEERVPSNRRSIALLLDLLEQGKGLSRRIDQFSRMLMKEPDVDLGALIRETVFVGDRKKRIYPRSLRQRTYCNAINHKDLAR